MPACANTGDPSGSCAKGGNGSVPGAPEKKVNDLHPLDHRAHGLDDAEAAVIRHFGTPGLGGAERAAHDRVAGRDRRGADDHLPRIDRQQAHLLNIQRGAVPDQPAEGASRLRAGQHGWTLGGLGRRRARALAHKRRAAAERGRAGLQHLPPAQAASLFQSTLHGVLPAAPLRGAAGRISGAPAFCDDWKPDRRSEADRSSHADLHRQSLCHYRRCDGVRHAAANGMAWPSISLLFAAGAAKRTEWRNGWTLSVISVVSSRG
jgi:hypothetical protein